MGFKSDQCKLKIAKCRSQNRIEAVGLPMIEFASEHFAFFNLHFAFCNESNYEMLH